MTATIEVDGAEFAVLLVGLAQIAVDKMESTEHKQRAHALIEKLLTTYRVGPECLFRGTVSDAGGGLVTVRVDRDTMVYPECGTAVKITRE